MWETVGYETEVDISDRFTEDLSSQLVIDPGLKERFKGLNWEKVMWKFTEILFMVQLIHTKLTKSIVKHQRTKTEVLFSTMYL